MNAYNSDSRSNSADSSRPLCVDLDGSLIRSDLTYEALALLLRSHFFCLFLLPFWLMRGKAYFKMQLARRVWPNAALLPYRAEVIALLRAQKANGRYLVLATASPMPYARLVADHLDLFDQIEASDDIVNLSGLDKAERLLSLYGKDGYDYLGNGAVDYPVWDHAHEALVVGQESAALAYAERSHARYLEDESLTEPRWQVWVRALRLHQWLKNTLLFVPAILNSQTVSFSEIWHLLAAFLAFSFAASSVYLINDVMDIETDRRHRSKFARPIASAQISPLLAGIAALGLIALALALSIMLNWLFTVWLVCYLLATTCYSLFLKRMLLIDALTLSGLFAIRVIAGAVVISAPISTWLLAFSMFFFLSMALVKRYVELSHQMEVRGRVDTGRGYLSVDLETLAQGGMASGFASVVVLAMFIDTPEMSSRYSEPSVVWLLCPLVLYIVVRIWILARRKQLPDDPLVFLMTDWRSLLMIFAGICVMIVAQIL